MLFVNAGLDRLAPAQDPFMKQRKSLALRSGLSAKFRFDWKITQPGMDDAPFFSIKRCH